MVRKVQLMTTAAAFVAAGFSGVAGAQTVETVYGAGASLPAPYFRQAADCYSVDGALIFAGTPPVVVTDTPEFNYTGTPAQNCATTDAAPNDQIVYKSTGSGTGIASFYSHEPAVAGDVSAADGTQLFPKIDFALSETSLSASDVAAYNNGGTVQGVTVVAPGVTPATGQYQNPRYNYGAMIQFPLLIAPVTIAYDPVYKKLRNGDGSITEFAFNLRYGRADGTGGMRLDQPTICGIFNGDVVNFADNKLTKLNGNVKLQDPADPETTFTAPLQIVGREDSSGTTSLWTRFLAKACESYAGNNYADSTSRLPGTYVDLGGSTRTTTAANGEDLVGAVWDKSSVNFGTGRVFRAGNDAEVRGKYTLANGNDGVAKYIDFTQEPGPNAGNQVRQARIGYVGPDFVLPGVLFTEANNYNLHTADVKNVAGQFRSPNATAVRAAFSGINPPESTSGGTYVANPECASGTVSASCRNQPQDWVEPASKNSPLAAPSNAAAYPIVGTSNFLGYTCYGNAPSRRTLTGFLNYYEQNNTINDYKLGLLASAGFQPLPAGWRKAIWETFVLGTDPNGLNLTLSQLGLRTQCPTGGEFGPRTGG